MPRGRIPFWAGLAAAGAAVTAVALPRHPGYQEWRCRRLDLEGLRALDRRAPDSPVVLYHLGRALHQDGRSAEAADALRRAARLDADSARVREALAEAQLGAGQTRETFEVLRQYLEMHPDSPEAYHMLGRFLLGVRTYSRAVVVLGEATRRFPSDGEGWKLLANARQQFRDFHGARGAVVNATALLPKDPEAWLLQARIFRDGGVAGAKEAYETAMRLAPSDVELRAEFAEHLARHAAGPQDYVYATDLARAVLQRSPGHPGASAALGLALAERGEAAEALPLLRETVKGSPGDARLLRTLARLHQRQGDAAEAKRWFEAARLAQSYRDEQKRLLDALETRPRDGALLRQMASLAGRHGDVPNAARYHGIALGQPPDAPAPLLAAARDLRAGGFADAARQVAERSRQNSRSTGEREAAEAFLDALK